MPPSYITVTALDLIRQGKTPRASARLSIWDSGYNVLQKLKNELQSDLNWPSNRPPEQYPT